MASFVYNSFWFDALTGAIDIDTDTFYTKLVTHFYTENKDTHTKRSDVTNEVTGTGYTAGGIVQPITVTKDNATDRVILALGTIQWPSSTITARKAITYKRRGGASSADELVCCNDFGSDQSSDIPGGVFLIGNGFINLLN
jgi:hypothetical protein